MIFQSRSKDNSDSKFHVTKSGDGSSQLYNKLSFLDFKWLLEGASWITEAQTFYLINEEGDFLLLQIAYSNLAWPAKTICQTSIHYFKGPEKTSFLQPPKDGQDNVVSKLYSANNSSSKMNLNSSRQSITVKETCMIFENGKFYLKHESPILKLNLCFEPLTDPFSINDGNIHFGVNKTDGFINLKFIPFGKVEGTINNQNYRGNGILIHQFQGVKPYLSACRWDFFYFCSSDGKTSFFVIQIKTPKSYGNEVYSNGSIYHSGKLIAVTTNNTITNLKPVMDPESHYWIPSEVVYDMKGTTFEGQKVNCSCSVKPSRLTSKICILDNLPFVIRKVVEAFMSRPFVYQWVQKGSALLNIGNESRNIDGWCFQEISLINEE